jgi:uncharacterized protein
MIIDIHSHLGDILNPNGKELIGKKGIKKEIEFDIISVLEAGLHESLDGIDSEWSIEQIEIAIIEASRARNFTASLENMRISMDEAGVDKTACMPIPPHLTFDDLKAAQVLDPGIIPFTGVDYTREYDVEAALIGDVKQGAKGMKLHPIIQQIPLNSPETLRTVEAFAVHNLPILFHCGTSEYYLNDEKATNQNPAFGAIKYAAELVAAFPGVSFIAGHAGLFEYQEVISLLKKFKNVWVDISFQASDNIKELIAVFGPERVMYASDWPFGERIPAIQNVKKACEGDSALENRIFHENAAELLDI